jgi:polar amino acid transport system substrate-binding protein
MALAATAWVWLLAAFLFALVWTGFERPGPPVKELFPYGELRIGVDASYPPFAVATADDLFGVDIDMGRALGERLHIPVRFVNMGYDGLYDSLKADQVDLLISALLIDQSRTAEVRYTLPYYNAGLVLVSDAQNEVSGMADLPTHSLAYEFGSEADQLAARWLRRVPPFDTRPYELPEYALAAVRLKQADAALADATSARLYLRAHPDWRAVYHYVTDSQYAMAVRIDRGAMWEAVNTALAGLLEDGTVERILKKWL